MMVMVFQGNFRKNKNPFKTEQSFIKANTLGCFLSYFT
jgi:hypothetical protein